MTGSTERLYQTLERLRGELSQLSHQFEDTYREYITALANAVRHQLILATYHLCTQGYPEAFFSSLIFPTTGITTEGAPIG